MGEGICVRLLIDKPADGAWNMAVDEAVLRMTSIRRNMLTVRLYMWERPTVSVGYFSRLTEGLLDRCKKRGIDVVRRLSGGGIVFHDDEVTYSVVLPKGLISDCSVLTVCKFVSEGVIIGLSELGVDGRLAHSVSACASGRVEGTIHGALPNAAEFCYAMHSPTDIVVGSAKLVGSAQARCNGAILQHGSVPLGWDKDMLRHLFGDGVLERHEFTSLEELLSYKPSVGDVIEALCVGFERAFGRALHVGKLSDDEVDLALRLAGRKWILRCS